MRRISRYSACALLGLAGGCNWISDADVAARQGDVDDDGDGVVAERDCDDNDPSLSPVAPEVWYDGIDQDCQGGDDYDQDVDGYVPTEFEGLTTQGVKGSGLLPGGDCDDQDPRVSPQQPDSPYDGIDQKCDGGDDYDADGDGYVPDEYVGLTTRYVDGSGALPGGDCDDENDSVHPGTVDAPYDGLDADCGGNDDYDADGDGFVPDIYLDLPTEYVTPSGNLPGGDCNDEDADFNPGVDETWYTGEDEKCDGFDDYDADADGYVPDEYEGLTTALVDGTGSLPPGDCDDLDPGVRPRVPETPGDGIDQDCDLGGDTLGDGTVGAWTMDGYTWIAPASPILREARNRIYLSLVARQVDTPSADRWYDAGFALYWDRGAVHNDESIRELAWSSPPSSDPSYDVGSAHDFILDGTTLYWVYGQKTTSSRTLVLVSYPLTSATTAGDAQATSSDGDDAYDDAAVAVDDSGAVHAVGCDGGNNGVLSYVRVDALEGSARPDVNQAVTNGSGSASACVLDLDGGPRVVAAHAGAVWQYPFDLTATDPTLLGVELSADYDPDDIDFMAEATLPFVVADPAQHPALTDLAGAASEVGIGASDNAAEVAVHDVGDGTLFVGWITSSGQARVAWGSEALGYTYQDVTVTGTPAGIAVWSDGDEAMVAVTTANNVGIGIYNF